MSQPTVTIFIPTYNRADLIGVTIRAVMQQTHENWQLLVLDDASTDGTREVVAQFLGDPRVRYHRHEKNVGMAGNWRAGLERVTTPYFCLLNDDDILAPEFIATLLPPLEADPDLVVAFADHWVIDGDEARLEEATEKTSAKHGRQFLTRGKLKNFGEAAILHRSLHISCSLLRTALVPVEFVEEKARGFACGYLFYRCFLSGHGAWYEPARLVSYRVHEGNMVSNPNLGGYLNDGQIFWCNEMLRQSLPEPLQTDARKQIASVFASHGCGLISAGHPKESQQFFQRSLTLRPTLKALGGGALSYLGPLGARILKSIRSIFQQNCICQSLPLLAYFFHP